MSQEPTAPIIVVDPSTIFHIDRDKLIAFTHDPAFPERLNAQISLYAELHASYGEQLLEAAERIIDTVVSGKEPAANIVSSVAMDGCRLNLLGWAAGMPRDRIAQDYGFDRTFVASNYEVSLIDGKADADEIARIVKVALEQWLGSVYATNELPLSVTLQAVKENDKLYLSYEVVRYVISTLSMKPIDEEDAAAVTSIQSYWVTSMGEKATA